MDFARSYRGHNGREIEIAQCACMPPELASAKVVVSFSKGQAKDD